VLIAPAVCQHQWFSRHFAPSKMVEFCVSCGSKVNPRDKFCFKCGSKVAETSHPSARISTPKDERALSSSSTRSLSQYLASKAEERRGHKLTKPNNKTGFKRKVNHPGSSSRQVVDNRVVINVGLITENEEGNLA